MGATTAWQEKNACIAPIERGLIKTEALARDVMHLEQRCEFLRRPVEPVASDQGPSETVIARRWVAKVIDLVTERAQRRNHCWLPFVAPRRCEIYFAFHRLPTTVLAKEDSPAPSANPGSAEAISPIAGAAREPTAGRASA